MNSHGTRGFSVVEMLVAVALFSAVILMSAAALIVLLDTNQKARSVKTSVDNLSFVIDDMSRNLRLGSKYYCKPRSLNNDPIFINASLNTQDCVFSQSDPNSGGQYLEFRDRVGRIVLYRFVDGGCIQKKVTNITWPGSGGSYSDVLTSGYSCVTPPDVTVDRVRFYTYNTSLSSTAQPFVVISIKGHVGSKVTTQTTFSVMTSISQRIPHSAE